MIGKKVLVVDDEELIRKFLMTLLIKRNYEVKEAADGEQAMEKLGRDKFDLVICDILMPNKDGWQILKEMKLNPKTKNIPVIVLTAKNGDSDMVKAYKLGADYYITKPFANAQLISAIQLMSEENSDAMDYFDVFR